MTKLLSRMFARERTQAVEPEPLVHSDVSTAHLDLSFNLLRSTALEVSDAAVHAAEALSQRLSESEHRFFSTIDSVKDFIQIKDGDGRWLTVNAFGQEILGLKPVDYFGKTDDELIMAFPHFHDCFEVCKQTDASAWMHRQSVRADERLIRSGGEEKFFDVIKTPVFNADGSRKELIIIGRDITELRNRERRMKACFIALNSASDPIVILDGAGRIYFCNDRFSKIMGTRDYNDLVGKHLDDVIPDFVDYKNVWSIVSENKIWEGEMNKAFNVSILPVMNGVPDPIYYICTLKRI